MRMTRTFRVLAMAAGVAASLLASGARPAHAAVTVGDDATWTKVYGMQEGLSPVDCTIRSGGVEGTDHWSCYASSPLIANGADCTQEVYVDAESGHVGAPVPGCTAELSNLSWSGDAVCATNGVCHADGALGTATFTFQPVAGTPVRSQPATITDASCTASGGHASVVSEGTSGFAMRGDLTWVGSCTDTSLLIWSGTVTVI